MKAQELRQLSPEELKAKIRLWEEERFRHRFQGEGSEKKDTSVFSKLRRNIARAKFILSEKQVHPQDKVLGKSETNGNG